MEGSTKAPSTRMRIFLKTEVFFSVLALRPHVNGVFGMRKRRFSKTLSRVEVFENAVFVFTCRRVKTEVFENAVFVFTRGRVKTEVFENDDVMTRVLSVVLCTFSRWQPDQKYMAILLELILSIIACIQNACYYVKRSRKYSKYEEIREYKALKAVIQSRDFFL